MSTLGQVLVGFAILLEFCHGNLILGHSDDLKPKANASRVSRSEGNWSLIPLEYREDCDGRVIICDLRKSYCDRIESACKSCEENCGQSYLDGFSEPEYRSQVETLCQQKCKTYYEFLKNESARENTSTGSGLENNTDVPTKSPSKSPGEDNLKINAALVIGVVALVLSISIATYSIIKCYRKRVDRSQRRRTEQQIPLNHVTNQSHDTSNNTSMLLPNGTSPKSNH